MPEHSEKSVDITVIESNAVDRKVVCDLIRGAESFGLNLNVSAVDPEQLSDSKKECDLLIVPYDLMQAQTLTLTGKTIIAILSRRSHPEIPKSDKRVDGYLYKEDLNPLSILPWCHLANERSSK